MPTLLRTLQHASWMQWLLVLVLGCNSVLIVWGIHVVPATLATSDGIGALVAPLGLQMGVALLALVGPLSFERYRSSIGISLLFGSLFAAAYDGIVLLQLLGIPLDLNIWLLFVSAAALAGFLAGYQTRQFRPGVIAAIWTLVIGTAIWSTGILLINYVFWGTHPWYLFWLNDGAIDEFQKAGSGNVNVFLLQDLQGALLFHPLLSVVLGAICGLIASGGANVLRWFQRTLATNPNS